MAAKRFKSKVDNWIAVVLALAIVAQAVGIGAAAIQSRDPLMTTVLILVGVAVSALIIWLTLGTHYTVDRRRLTIASGPFRWKVDIDEIKSVEATRNPLSSPALSLDRLMIHYGKRRRIMVSPADKTGFLEAIGHNANG